MHIDFETYSKCDLKKAGAMRYARDPSTILVSIHYELNGAAGSWNPDDPMPAEVRAHVESGGLVNAFNSFFEYCIWNYVGVPQHDWPCLPIEQTRDTMAEAAYNGLPMDLDTCAKVRTPHARKDPRGKLLIDVFSKDTPIGPKKIADINAAFGTDFATKDVKSQGITRATREDMKPILLHFLHSYNEDDVKAEKAIHKSMEPLPPTELKVWLLDQKINLRGVHLDLEAIFNAKEVVKIAVAHANKRIYAITGGDVEAVTSAPSIIKWLWAQGVDTDSVAAGVLDDILTWPHLSENVREVLNLRKDYGSSSVAKLDAMVACNIDGVAYGLLQYFGATTGRWAGRLVQPQNLPRPSFEVAPEIFHGSDPVEIYKKVCFVYDKPVEAVKNALRHFIIAKKDHVLAACDFSGIESRVVAWIAEEEWKLEAFRAYDRGEGKDNYLHAADVIFGYECASKKTHAMERQTGKIAELACGYQGWLGAWRAFDSSDKWTDDEVIGHLIKWRENHPAIVALWKGLDQAAVHAVRNPGKLVPYKKVTFFYEGDYLYCRLPSGRLLHYYEPEVFTDMNRGGEHVAFWAMKQVGTRKMWTRVEGYGGLFAENIVQAISRDLMVVAMFQAEEACMPIVLTVHDELVTQPSIASGLDHRVLEKIMSTPPAWAHDLPLASEGWTDVRYRK